MMNVATPYQGSFTHPRPPSRGYRDIGYADEVARRRAEQIKQHIESGAIGDPGAALPVWTYRDEWLPTGLHRFFHMQTPIGSQISAMRFTGEESLGTPPAPAGAIAVDPTVAENAATSWSPTTGNSDMDEYAVQINDAGPGDGDRTYLWYEKGLYRFTSGMNVTAPGVIGTKVEKASGLPANWTPPGTPGTSSSSSSSSATPWIIGGVVVALAIVGGVVATR